ncbi:hypothetical protein ACWYXK_11720 [Janthinobacterium lividum]
MPSAGYLFARRTKDYYGIIGWHLARPSPAPRHWSTGTKAWISSHIFGSTCLIAFNDMQRWAKEVCRAGTVSGMLSAEIAAFARVVMDVEGRGRQARSDEAVAGVQHSLTLAQVAALFLFGPEGGGREEGARLRFLALSLMVCRDKGGNGTKVLRLYKFCALCAY